MTNDDELLKRLENDPVSRAMALEAAARIREQKEQNLALHDIVVRYVDQTDDQHSEMMRDTVRRYREINKPLLEASYYQERIRELKAERDEAVTQMVEAKIDRDAVRACIRELKAEVAALKHDIERYVIIAGVEGDDG